MRSTVRDCHKIELPQPARYNLNRSDGYIDQDALKNPAPRRPALPHHLLTKRDSQSAASQLFEGTVCLVAPTLLRP
jgi:hypothetical protein